MKPRMIAAALALAPWLAMGPPAIAAGPSYSIVQRVSGADGFWDYASFDPASRRIYVAHGDAVMAIDAKSGAATPHFADGSRLHAIVPIPGTNDLLTTNGGDDTARILSASTGALETSIHTGKGPDAAVFDPASGRVFVMDHAGGDVAVIDVKRKINAGSIAVGGALEFAAVDGKGKLFVNIEDKSEIAVLSTRSDKVLARYALKGCEEPSGLAYTTEGLLISACANGVAKVLNAASGAEVATLKIGARPDAVIYDASRKLAYIPCGGDGTLTVIATGPASKVKVLGEAQTQRGARTGTTDPSTGRIYLPTAQFTPPPAPGQRPGFVPGSFQVLVLAPG